MRKKIVAMLSIILCFVTIAAMPTMAEADKTKNFVVNYEGFSNIPDFGSYFSVLPSLESRSSRHTIDSYTYCLNALPSGFEKEYTRLLKEHALILKSQTKNENNMIYYYENAQTYETVVMVIGPNQVNVYISKRR